MTSAHIRGERGKPFEKFFVPSKFLLEHHLPEGNQLPNFYHKLKEVYDLIVMLFPVFNFL